MTTESSHIVLVAPSNRSTRIEKEHQGNVPLTRPVPSVKTDTSCHRLSKQNASPQHLAGDQAGHDGCQTNKTTQCRWWWGPHYDVMRCCSVFPRENRAAAQFIVPVRSVCVCQRRDPTFRSFASSAVFGESVGFRVFEA